MPWIEQCENAHYSFFKENFPLDLYFFYIHVGTKGKLATPGGNFLTDQRGSYKVWKINMGVCPRLEFDNIMFINCLGYDFYMYGAFEFLCNSIAKL